MKKINQLTVTFFKDESLRSRSLIIGGLPLIIFIFKKLSKQLNKVSQ